MLFVTGRLMIQEARRSTLLRRATTSCDEQVHRRYSKKGIPMLIASLLLSITTPALAAPVDWMVAQGAANCSATDVDFSDARHGFCLVRVQ